MYKPKTCSCDGISAKFGQWISVKSSKGKVQGHINHTWALFLPLSRHTEWAQDALRMCKVIIDTVRAFAWMWPGNWIIELEQIMYFCPLKKDIWKKIIINFEQVITLLCLPMQAIYDLYVLHHLAFSVREKLVSLTTDCNSQGWPMVHLQNSWFMILLLTNYWTCCSELWKGNALQAVKGETFNLFNGRIPCPSRLLI